jgi:two-component system, chemotaxis family, protein-glutamate methylesterase/glutaminase
MIEDVTEPLIVVIGGSIGGVEALQQLVSHLPADLPTSLLIAIHTPASLPCFPPQILQCSGNLLATHAVDGIAIDSGHIYVALPNHHLLVKRGFIQVRIGPKENGFRPAIDPLFRTAAHAYGKRVIGVYYLVLYMMELLGYMTSSRGAELQWFKIQKKHNFLTYRDTP